MRAGGAPPSCCCRDVAGKVKDSVVQLVSPKEERSSNKPARQQQRQGAPLMQQPERPGLLGGLLGRAVGGLVASAVNQIGQQVAGRKLHQPHAWRIHASKSWHWITHPMRIPLVAQIEKAAEESRGVYDEAAARVVASDKLQPYLGQVCSKGREWHSRRSLGVQGRARGRGLLL